MGAKREKVFSKDCAPDGALAGGTPAVPANHLSFNFTAVAKRAAPRPLIISTRFLRNFFFTPTFKDFSLELHIQDALLS
jgi:hypothetical protein